MSQITENQRYSISSMQDLGLSQTEIAQKMGVHKSTISRELSRNMDKRNGKYHPALADRKCRARHKNKPKYERFTLAIQELAERYLKEDYSPEQIVGICKKEEIDCVSAERIYQHIWSDKKQGGTLHTHLRRQGRRYRKRGNSKDTRGIIKNRISIAQRPESVENRTHFGDLEVDLIIGADHKSAILTINDRASGVLKMKKIHSKEASEVTEAINDLLEEWKPYIRTITADNGKEFAGHEDVAEQLLIDYYFARPYHSWERGSNENLNGLIRQYFPKKTDFRKISHEQIEKIQTKLNNRPRKRYKYETPIFVMNQLLFNNQNVAFIT